MLSVDYLVIRLGLVFIVAVAKNRCFEMFLHGLFGFLLEFGAHLRNISLQEEFHVDGFRPLFIVGGHCLRQLVGAVRIGTKTNSKGKYTIYSAGLFEIVS